jgi:hypothetical protein
MQQCSTCGSKNIFVIVEGHKIRLSPSNRFWETLKFLLGINKKPPQEVFVGVHLYTCEKCGAKWLWGPANISPEDIAMFKAIYGPNGEDLPEKTKKEKNK